MSAVDWKSSTRKGTERNGKERKRKQRKAKGGGITGGAGFGCECECESRFPMINERRGRCYRLHTCWRPPTNERQLYKEKVEHDIAGMILLICGSERPSDLLALI